MDRRKVVLSQKSGNSNADLNVPKLEWYTTADAFLQKHMEIREITDNLVSTNTYSFY